jgi:sodium/potassium-transporting ATPase subunit alpha
MIGNVANFQRNIRTSKSLLSSQLERFVKLFSAVAVLMGLLFFVIGTAISGSQYLLYNFMTGFIIVIVANIPQGK